MDISGHPIHVGFRYDSIIRKLILRAKVKNEVPALAALETAMRSITDGQIGGYNSVETLVVAATSSLRSRLRGRFDVAQVLATRLFQGASHSKVHMPGDFWRSKRAGENQRIRSKPYLHMFNRFYDVLKKSINFSSRINDPHEIQDKISSYSCIVVVDDVLTTGFTMGTLINHLKTLGARRIEGLVVAAADPETRPRSDENR